MHAEFIRWTNIKYKSIRKRRQSQNLGGVATIEVKGKFLYWLSLPVCGAA